jgi:hypothetical protein
VRKSQGLNKISRLVLVVGTYVSLSTGDAVSRSGLAPLGEKPVGCSACPYGPWMT